MKRTISINLGGFLFNVDEDAYYLLQDFLYQQEQKQSPGSDKKQFIEALEAEVADKLIKQFPELKDKPMNKENLMKILSGYGFQEKSPYQPQYETYRSTSQRKLTRSRKDKAIAGVCAGLAHYFDIEIWVMRVLFLVAFLGYGIGFLVYILLWIAVPKEKLN